jgi:hypothetical protein
VVSFAKAKRESDRNTLEATKRERTRRKLVGEKSSREKQLEMRDHTATDISARGNEERGRERK